MNSRIYIHQNNHADIWEKKTMTTLSKYFYSFYITFPPKKTKNSNHRKQILNFKGVTETTGCTGTVFHATPVWFQSQLTYKCWQFLVPLCIFYKQDTLLAIQPTTQFVHNSLFLYTGYISPNGKTKLMLIKWTVKFTAATMCYITK